MKCINHEKKHLLIILSKRSSYLRSFLLSCSFFMIATIILFLKIKKMRFRNINNNKNKIHLHRKKVMLDSNLHHPWYCLLNTLVPSEMIRTDFHFSKLSSDDALFTPVKWDGWKCCVSFTFINVFSKVRTKENMIQMWL